MSKTHKVIDDALNFVGAANQFDYCLEANEHIRRLVSEARRLEIANHRLMTIARQHGLIRQSPGQINEVVLAS